MTFYHKAIYDLAAIVKLMADKVSPVDRMQILTLLKGVLDYLDSMGLFSKSDIIYEEPTVVVKNLINYVQYVEEGPPSEHTSTPHTNSPAENPVKRNAKPKVSRHAAEKRPPPPHYDTFDDSDDSQGSETVHEEVTDWHPIEMLQNAVALVAQEDERKYSTDKSASRSNVKVSKKKEKSSTRSRQNYVPEGVTVVNPVERSRYGNKSVKKWPDTKWACPYCRLVLAGFQYYKCHLAKKHETEGACCCRFCKKEFVNGELAKYHPCTAKNRCTICKKLFDRPSKLARHMKTHTRKQEYLVECRLCKPRQAFPTAIECARHVFDVHETLIKCDSCFLDMDPTERVIEDSSRIYCMKCERVFGQKPVQVFKNSNGDVMYILSRGHNSKSGLDAKKPRKSLLEKSMKTSEQDVTRCVMCSFVTRDVSELDRHMQDVHKVSNMTSTYQCSMCLVNFSTQEALTNHEKEVHTGTTSSYQCPRCDKTFMTSGGIKQHVRSHLNLREFRCTSCPLRFNSLSDLNNHVAWKHTTGFPHKCSTCGRRFRHRRLLKGHIRFVHDRKVFMCPLCPYSDVRNSSILKDHIKRRHPEHKWTQSSDYCKKSNRPYVMTGNRTLEGYVSGEERDNTLANDMVADEGEDEMNRSEERNMTE